MLAEFDNGVPRNKNRSSFCLFEFDKLGRHAVLTCQEESFCAFEKRVSINDLPMLFRAVHVVTPADVKGVGRRRW